MSRAARHFGTGSATIAAGNRRFAAYSIALASTAPVCQLAGGVPPAVRDRLRDAPISPQTSLPSPVVAVTVARTKPERVAPFEVTSTVFA